MKTVKFTKGPWSICPDCWADGHVSIDSKNHAAIAVVVSEMEDDDCEIKRKELKGNAKIIKLAPEMLALLLKIESGDKDFILNGKMFDEIEDVLSELRG